MAQELVTANYKHTYTPLQLLTQLSPQVTHFLSDDILKEFNAYLISTNDSFEEIADIARDIPDLQTQKELIRRFRLQGDIPSKNLFNGLIGGKFYNGFIKRRCNVYYKHPDGVCLYQTNRWFNGWFRIKKENDVVANYSNWKSVDSYFAATLNSLIGIQTDTECSAVLEELKRDNEISEKFSSAFKLNGKSVPQCMWIFRNKLLYSRNSTGKSSSMHLSPLSHNFQFTLRNAKVAIFSKHELSNLPKKIKLDEYIGKIHENYNGCNIRSLLLKHCPLLTDTLSVSLEKKLQMNNSHKQIFSFIYALYYKIFPTKCFGSSRNQRKFFDNLKHLFTAGLTAKFRVWDIIHGLELDRMKHLFEDIQSIVSVFPGWFETHFLLWVFDCILHLVKSNFYITEGSKSFKNALLFYRFDLWASISRHATQQNVNEEKWKLKTTVKTKELCSSFSDYISTSSCRYIPKKSSLRPIMSLKFKKKLSTFESKLKIIQLFLKRLRELTAFDSDNQFKDRWSLHRKISKIKSNFKGPFYVVRGDFESCYPSIKPDLLLHMVLKTLTQLAQGDFFKKDLFGELIQLTKKKGNFYPKKSRLIIVHKESTFLHKDDLAKLTAIEQQLGRNVLKNSIITSERLVKPDELEWSINQLKTYLNKVIFRLGKKTTYNMTCGIRQGGPLSSDLCEIYLNCLWHHACGEFLTNAPGADHFLLKLADDFLFVSVDPQKAQRFAHIMTRGFPEFNLQINMNKFFTNFDLDSGEIKDELINFYGRRINPKDLHVNPDLTSFTNVRIVDTFSCNPFKPIFYIMKSLTDFMPLNCYPEMFDCAISSVDNVSQNIFSYFLLQVARFAGYVVSSPNWKGSSQLFPDICSFIFQLARKMSSLINKWKRKCPQMHCPLSPLNILYIAVCSFQMFWEHGPKKIRSRTEGNLLAKCRQMLESDPRKGNHLLNGGVKLKIPDTLLVMNSIIL